MPKPGWVTISISEQAHEDLSKVREVMRRRGTDASGVKAVTFSEIISLGARLALERVAPTPAAPRRRGDA
jgi:hypothetical protein